MANKLRIYNTTIERDSDAKRDVTAYYPNITYVDGFPYSLSYGTDAPTSTPTIKLLDIIVHANNKLNVCRDALEVSALVTQYGLANVHLVGICVIPESFLYAGSPARIMAFEDVSGYAGYVHISSVTNVGTNMQLTSANYKYIGSFVSAYCELDGTTSTNIWAGYAVDANGDEFIPKTKIPCINQEGSSVAPNLHRRAAERLVESFAVLPSDNFSIGNSVTTDAGLANNMKYFFNNCDECNYVASPYASTGKLNKDYIASTFSSFRKDSVPDLEEQYVNYISHDSYKVVSGQNPLRDFDGYLATKSHLNAICSVDSNSTLYNGASERLTDNNVMKNAWTYSTTGTTAGSISGERVVDGDWYIPTIGELGFIMPRLAAINNTISQLMHLDFSGLSTIVQERPYASSSQCTVKGIYGLLPLTGQIFNFDRANTLYGRPFMELNYADTIL